MAVEALKPKNAVESLRDIVQDLLVPELKSLKVEMVALRNELHSSNEALRNELHASNEALRNEIRSSNESLRMEMHLRDDKQTMAIQNLADKLGLAMEVRERLAVLEDRLPRN